MHAHIKIYVGPLRCSNEPAGRELAALRQAHPEISDSSCASRQAWTGFENHKTICTVSVLELDFDLGVDSYDFDLLIPLCVVEHCRLRPEKSEDCLSVASSAAAGLS